MSLSDINYLAVLTSAVIWMVIGFLWYSPLLFAKPWITAMGYDVNDKRAMDELRKGAGKTYGITFVACMLSAFGIDKLLLMLDLRVGPPPFVAGVKLGLLVWACFVLTVQLTNMLFSRQNSKVFLINTGYQLVCYVATGALLAWWR